MTAAQIATLTRFVTNTNSTTVSDTNFLRMLTERHKQLFIELTKLKEGYGETTATDNLVASTQNYSLPSGTLRIKRVEVLYSTGGTWRQVNIFDINEKSSANDSTTIAGEFSQTKPYGDILGTSIYLYPIPNAAVTGGLKFWYIANPAELTATTETPTAPAEYHRMLADLVALDIRMMKGELSAAGALQEEIAMWEVLRRQVSPRASSQDPVAKPLYINYA